MKQVRISAGNFAPLDLVIAAAKNGIQATINGIQCNIAANCNGWITAVITGTEIVVHGWAGQFTI